MLKFPVVSFSKDGAHEWNSAQGKVERSFFRPGRKGTTENLKEVTDESTIVNKPASNQ